MKQLSSTTWGEKFCLRFIFTYKIAKAVRAEAMMLMVWEM